MNCYFHDYKGPTRVTVTEITLTKMNLDPKLLKSTVDLIL
jgi:hypothetical protein